MAELLEVRARGVERGEQSQHLFSHRSFDQKWLVQLRFPQRCCDLGGGLFDPAAAAGATQRTRDPATDSLAAAAGVGPMASTARASGLAIPSGNRLVKMARKVG